MIEPRAADDLDRATRRRRAVEAARRDAIRARSFGVKVNALSPQDYLARYDQPCSYCGLCPSNGSDHAVPLCRGGAHAESNLVPCCRRCNRAKGKRTRAEFRLGRGAGAAAVTRGTVVPSVIVEVVRLLYRDGWPAAVLARALDVAPATMSRWIRSPSGRRTAGGPQ